MRILLILLFISFNSLGQDFAIAKEEEDKLSKFYIGLGAGFASKGGDLTTDAYSNGIHLNFLNLGYRINQTFGVTANFTSSGHKFDYDYSSIGIAYLSVGGILSIPTEYFTIDIKPQYAPRVFGAFYGDILDDLDVYEMNIYGSGFVFGNSIVRSTKKGISFSLDIDYLSARFDESRINGLYYDDGSDYSSFRIGIGFRYNFRTK